MNKNITYDYVKQVYEKMSYKFYDTGIYNLNIFGIRSSNKLANKFDDFVCIAYKNADNKKIVMVYDATTDPGTYYLNEPMNINGTAILKPGQYRSSHKIGLHQGKYEALVQRGKLKVYRDNTKDTKLDFNESTVQEGDSFGINIHRATANQGQKSSQVDKWSAGCTVIASNDDFSEFMAIIRQGAKHHGEWFTYTLFIEDQFFG